MDKFKLPSDSFPSDSLEKQVYRLNNSLESSSAEFLLEHCLKNEFPNDVALVSSFGTEAAILLHMISKIKPDLDVVFINTGKIFPLTLTYRDQLVQQFKLSNVKEINPDQNALDQYDPNGDLWKTSVEQCCEVRKVVPTNKALANYRCWISGRKRSHGGSRLNLKHFEYSDGHVKINPLAYWSRMQINAYFEKHNIPRHPLLEQGYLSVGCHHCSAPSFDPDDPRSGRWKGQGKTECGIHKVDGKWVSAGTRPISESP